MRIIKEGDTRRTALAGRWECRECGCVIELEDADIGPYYIDVGGNAYGRCPTCRKHRGFQRNESYG